MTWTNVHAIQNSFLSVFPLLNSPSHHSWFDGIDLELENLAELCSRTPQWWSWVEFEEFILRIVRRQPAKKWTTCLRSSQKFRGQSSLYTGGWLFRWRSGDAFWVIDLSARCWVWVRGWGTNRVSTDSLWWLEIWKLVKVEIRLWSDCFERSRLKDLEQLVTGRM